MKEIVDASSGEVEAFELCKTRLGWTVPGFRMGEGSKNVFLLGREHGAEPMGTCGLTALIEGLAEGKLPGTRRAFPLAGKILRRFTLYMLPVMNPDGADRFSRQVRESFVGPPEFGYNKEDSDRFYSIHCEPGVTLNKRRPPHFTEADMEAWRKTGRPIGSLFTEDGVELWMDWQYDKAPQTKALKSLMHNSKPFLFVDIHGPCGLTTLYMPGEMDEDALEEHRRLGRFLYGSLDEAGVPITQTKEVEPMKPWQGLTSIFWVYQTFGEASYQYLYEVDIGYRWYDPQLRAGDVHLPTISKAQIIAAVWGGITGLLKGLMEVA